MLIVRVAILFNEKVIFFLFFFLREKIIDTRRVTLRKCGNKNLHRNVTYLHKVL